MSTAAKQPDAEHPDAKGPETATSRAERRANPRQQVQSLPFVELDADNGGVLFNISESGMAVTVAAPLPEGGPESIRIQLPKTKKWIELAGKIAWRGKSRKEAGIQFLNLSETALKQIRAFIKEESRPQEAQEAESSFSWHSSQRREASVNREPQSTQQTERIAEAQPAAKGVMPNPAVAAESTAALPTGASPPILTPPRTATLSEPALQRLTTPQTVLPPQAAAPAQIEEKRIPAGRSSESRPLERATSPAKSELAPAAAKPTRAIPPLVRPARRPLDEIGPLDELERWSARQPAPRSLFPKVLAQTGRKPALIIGTIAVASFVLGMTVGPTQWNRILNRQNGPASQTSQPVTANGGDASSPAPAGPLAANPARGNPGATDLGTTTTAATNSGAQNTLPPTALPASAPPSPGAAAKSAADLPGTSAGIPKSRAGNGQPPPRAASAGNFPADGNPQTRHLGRNSQPTAAGAPVARNSASTNSNPGSASNAPSSTSATLGAPAAASAGNGTSGSSPATGPLSNASNKPNAPGVGAGTRPPQAQTTPLGWVSVSADPYPSIRLPADLKTSNASGSLEFGQLLSHPDPAYPQDAAQQGLEGTVKLHAIIGRDGTIASVTVLSGPSLLAPAATSAIRQWRYKQTLLGGQPIETEEDISAVFRLRKPSSAP